MIFPAIDIQGGQSVRLYQGQFNQETLVSSNPIKQAKKINAKQIKCLHLVDLDGAKAGSPQNFAIVKSICQTFKGLVEIGGGIRSVKTIERYLQLGISRVILGSAALKNPVFTKQAIKQFGSAKVVIGVDGRDGKVATEGWLDQSEITMVTLITEMIKAGAQNFIVTDVSRDGTMVGPNIKLLQGLQQEFPQANIIASGGVRNFTDIKKLQIAGIKDIVVGKALYEGTITLKEVSEVNAYAC
ncbi:1-(5-phosphoribosyl)-5-[(5-phosphoribosylamino)methylideneamino]imidazole-4-carboxamide isomerase [Limosilactobacillus reuteri]|uniref:1-(5-phosphoribosyl)-5-[(5-phosphoribosylamino)methylideneamino] imidazole-4-carboxamide isomerase n=1 Tax=Limosilactobacillus reuteri TaxID=1598 RepID=A0ABD6Y4G3_LIMRT|nr:1-(5-phosphoribosyl)-5-[(5-phosphoribosylamino)methylideneamino]imidazole-4-carboxamide isomerase [Limosilactobacillus reuteri]MCC4468192.1 1-(5-phosphoribosyl)-5-[(5-phosphoribosylamino)methylideneamino]imidazole-4-carboxamide isomerase [Limosilactobacillus reuteri]MCC4472106.1 1-(5-phosphoribosyl)-5-[(5-phosphoribosylamino)methylideneamino]imidazole-4-carboxamide isomerase [Limosilactobacillus reuteri]MCT3190341.1 1-(5-phosphoribosyl)-5-[(5-phosphoribosylamino)methylideneamino]imidazole-4-c